MSSNLCECTSIKKPSTCEHFRVHYGKDRLGKSTMMATTREETKQVGGEVKGSKKTKLMVGGGGKGVLPCQSLVPRCLKCVARI